MSSAVTNDKNSTQISKKDKMNGDVSTLYLDGIPADTLSKVRVTWGGNFVVVFNYANLKFWWFDGCLLTLPQHM